MFVKKLWSRLKWLRGKIFSKKILLAVGSLIVLLVVTAVITRSVFNKRAEDRWVETEKAWSEYLGEGDRERRFLDMPTEEDFLQHPAVIVELNTDEGGLTEIWEMEFESFVYRKDSFRPKNEKDWKMMVKGMEFASRKEAAQFLLNALKEKEGQILGIEDALDTRKKWRAKLTDELTIDKVVDTDMSILKMLHWARFFESRAQLQIFIGDGDKALLDIKRIAQLTDLQLQENSWLAYLVANALHGITQSVVEEGVRNHLWTVEQLEQIEKWSLSFDSMQSYREAMIGEYYYYKDVVHLVRTIGQTEYLEREAVTMGARYWGESELRLEVFWKTIPSNYLLDQYGRVLGDLLSDSRDMELKSTLREYQGGKLEQADWSDFDRVADELDRILLRQGDVAYKGLARTRVLEVSLAVEKYYKGQGCFPENFEVLTPGYLDRVPMDPLNGGLIKYRLDHKGLPVVWAGPSSGEDVENQVIGRLVDHEDLWGEVIRFFWNEELE